jgi:RimJ/RimL family protein N-acetyltransferase
VAAEVELRGGARVRVRPIEPADRDILLAGFERLSEESRYRRFLSPTPRLSGHALTYLTEVDHHDHEALIAIDEARGEAVGVGRFVREPDQPDAAEAAITVIDDWQGRGLGTTLLDLLSDRAREEGIGRFTATLLAENREMLDLFEALGPVQVVDRRAGTIEIVAELPEQGAGPDLVEMLRMAARQSVRMAQRLGLARGE